MRKGLSSARRKSCWDYFRSWFRYGTVFIVWFHEEEWFWVSWRVSFLVHLWVNVIFIAILCMLPSSSYYILPGHFSTRRNKCFDNYACFRFCIRLLTEIILFYCPGAKRAFMWKNPCKMFWSSCNIQTLDRGCHWQEIVKAWLIVILHVKVQTIW